MDGEETQRSIVPSPPPVPVVRAADPAREPIDAKFRVLWAPLQWLRAYWWAIGAYIAYCAAIWGVAALVGWIL